MIYIDPPHTTPAKTSSTQIITGEGLATYLQWTKQVNDEGKKVSRTLSQSLQLARQHVYPRLRLVRNLLTPHGMIVIPSMGTNMQISKSCWLKVFGEACNLGSLVWDKRNPKGIPQALPSNVVVMFSAAIRGLPKEVGDFSRPKANAEAMVRLLQESCCKRWGQRPGSQVVWEWINKRDPGLTGGEAAYNQLDADGNIYRAVSMAWPKQEEGTDDYFRPLIHPVTGKPCPVPEAGWRNPPATMQSLLDSGQILFGRDESTQPTRKYLLADNMYENVASVLYYASSDDALLAKWVFHSTRLKAG